MAIMGKRRTDAKSSVYLLVCSFQLVKFFQQSKHVVMFRSQLSGTSVLRPQSRYTVSRMSHQIPAESEMSRQNRATPHKLRLLHLSPDPPLSHFPLVRSRQRAKGGCLGGLVEGIAALLVPKTDRVTGGCRSYSHTSRATLCN